MNELMIDTVPPKALILMIAHVSIIQLTSKQYQHDDFIYNLLWNLKLKKKRRFKLPLVFLDHHAIRPMMAASGHALKCDNYLIAGVPL